MIRQKWAEKNPIQMGDHILEYSASEKYLGDKIHEDGTAKSRMPTAIAKIKEDETLKHLEKYEFTRVMWKNLNTR